MDKNIAALLRTDCNTVEVRSVAFKEGEQARPQDYQNYTYVTDLELVVGDLVLVYFGSGNGRRIMEVMEVHDEVKIAPNHDIKYKWVICRIDFTKYNETMARNDEIEKAVSVNETKAHMRKVYVEQIVGTLPEDAQEAVRKLIQ